MNMIPNISPTRSKKAAFTVLELLVAVSILAVLVGVVARVVSSASNSIVKSESYLDIDSEARLVFDRLAVDINRMIRKKDLYYGVEKKQGNDEFRFFSEVKGVSSAADAEKRSNYSIINYRVDGNGALARAVAARTWFQPFVLANGGNHDQIELGDSYFTVIAPKVFRFEYTFLLKGSGGTAMQFSDRPYRPGEEEEEQENLDPTRIRGFRDVAAVVVGLALLDEKSRKKNVNITDLTARFPDSSGNSDILRPWRAVLNTLNQSEGEQNVRIYQRYFYLN